MQISVRYCYILLLSFDLPCSQSLNLAKSTYTYPYIGALRILCRFRTLNQVHDTIISEISMIIKLAMVYKVIFFQKELSQRAPTKLKFMCILFHIILRSTFPKYV